MSQQIQQSRFNRMAALRIVYEDLQFLAAEGKERMVFNARPIHIGSPKDGTPMTLGNIREQVNHDNGDMVLVFKTALQVGLVNLSIPMDLKTMYFKILEDIHV